MNLLFVSDILLKIKSWFAFNSKSFLKMVSCLAGSWLLFLITNVLMKFYWFGSFYFDVIGSITKKEVEEIAKQKMKDLNTVDIQKAIKIIEGTAHSMGISVEKKSEIFNNQDTITKIGTGS